jgi:hypothetical protein
MWSHMRTGLPQSFETRAEAVKENETGVSDAAFQHDQARLTKSLIARELP